MTRKQLHRIIKRAHDSIHSGDIEGAHEILHEGVMTEAVQSNTSDPEVQKACAEFLTLMENPIGCGHAIGDLVSAPGIVTFCGACRKEQQEAQ